MFKPTASCVWLALAGGLLAQLAVGTALLADSIWSRADPNQAFYFTDTKARNVGDLITILVSENTNVDQRDDRSLNKETSASENFSLLASSSGGFGEQGSSAKLDAKNASDREFKGGASFRQEREFIDHVTVTVMDVLPNGNLVLSGKRRVWIAGEEATLVVSGIARGIDIGPDNTLQSRYISELRLNYENQGPSKSFTRQGRLGRAANLLWPF